MRHRRMPMERLVWAIIGMAIFRHVPMTQQVNQLDMLRSQMVKMAASLKGAKLSPLREAQTTEVWS
jgi:hypothetical protein